MIHSALEAYMLHILQECCSSSQNISYVGCLYRRWMKCLPSRNRFYLARTKIRKAIVSNWSIFAFSLQLSPTEEHFYKVLQWPSCLYLFNLHPSEGFLWVGAIKYISVLQCMTQLRPLVLQKVTYNGPIMQLFLISVNMHRECARQVWW